MPRYGDLWVVVLFTSSNRNDLGIKGLIYGLFLVHLYAWMNNIFGLISCPPFHGCQAFWRSKGCERSPHAGRGFRNSISVTSMAMWQRCVLVGHMSCFGWLDVGTFLDEALGFPASWFFGEGFKYIFLLSSFLIFVFSPFLHFLHFWVLSFLWIQAVLLLFFSSKIFPFSMPDFLLLCFDWGFLLFFSYLDVWLFWG